MIAGKIRAAALLAAVFLSVAPAFAQSPSGSGATPPATFTFRAEPSPVRPGEIVTVWIDVALAHTWHIYSTTTPPGGPYPTQIALQDSTAFRQIGASLQPAPLRKHDPNFDLDVEYYTGAVRFGVRARVLASAPGRTHLKGRLTYMLCNDTSCLPPATHRFDVPVEIASGPPRAAYTSLAAAPPSEASLGETGSVADVTRAAAKGMGAFLYLSFTMGLLALLTPCVFPMVPITVSFFTKNESRSRSEAVVKSLVYCAGIVVTFTGLGLLLAATLGASGASRFAANPWVNLFITAVFVAFALSLFGLFEIRLPSGFLTRLSRVQGGSYGAILVMGFTFTLTSFTCTAPFVGTLLVLTSRGAWTWPILGMLTFSAAFALPFFFLALFPQGLAALPRSGGWLNSVKVVMGFLELAASLKFLSNADLVWGWGILSREVFLALWIAIFALCGAYLLGKIRLPHDTPIDALGPLRLLASLVCLAFSLYLFTGLTGAPMGELDAFFPPYSSHGAIAKIKSGKDLTWQKNFSAAQAEARREGRPLFVDFTGYACTNCRWMEANMFPRPNVHDLLERYVRVRMYTDGEGAQYTRNRNLQQTRFGTVALPFYAILSPDGREIARFPGLTRNRDLFVRFLKEGVSPSFRMGTLGHSQANHPD